MQKGKARTVHHKQDNIPMSLQQTSTISGGIHATALSLSRERLRSYFNLYDMDGNESLDLDEIKCLLEDFIQQSGSINGDDEKEGITFSHCFQGCKASPFFTRLPVQLYI